MKKSFITKEYTQESVSGTFAMKELRNFMSSKILEIPDTLTVNQNNILWSEFNDNTQGINIDNINKTLNTNDLKKSQHTIERNPNQSLKDIREYTRWTFKINVRTIIREWVFAQLKKNKTFSNIPNDRTKNNSINLAIYDYIDLNIFPRINFKTVLLYVRYYPIGSLKNNNIQLQYDAQFDSSIINPDSISGESTNDFLIRSDIFKKSLQIYNFNLQLNVFKEIATLEYQQTQSSANFKFDYYFDVVYEKS